MLSLGLLGSLTCKWGEEQIEIKARKAQALLVYLAMYHHTHQRSALAYLLWPDATDSRGRASLSRTLSTLRQTLGEAAFESSRDTIALSPHVTISCDLVQLETVASGCPQHTNALATSCDECLDLVEEAAALVRGSLLKGFHVQQAAPFEEWLDTRRSETDNLLLQTMSWLLEAYESRAAYPKALALGQRLLLLHPHHEPTARKLMQWYADQGDMPKSRQLYQRLCHSLRRTWALDPEPATVALYEALSKDQKVALEETRATESPTSNDSFDAWQADLGPEASTPFLGRQEELTSLCAQLRSKGTQRKRLISLVGPGGIGKTRLAQQTGKSLEESHHFSEGIWFIPLEAIHDASHVWPALAERLSYHPQPGQPLERQIFSYLKHKSILLVLDNTEQIEGFEECIRACIEHTSAPTFLVTSRKKLQLPEEWVFVLEGLRYPAQDEESDTAHHSAVAFFVQCGRRVDARFSPGPEEIDDIAWICRWVGGIPLCLELAASWLRALTCRQIREALAQDDSLLTSSLHDIPERQSSQRLVFETTWSMLSPTEREGFAQLSVFRGGMTFKAARSIAGVSPQDLRTWLDRFLIQRQADGRFALHALLRQYAAEKCDDATLPERHAAHYLSWLATQQDALASHTQISALRQVEADWNNVLAGWRWAISARQDALLAKAQDPLAQCFRLRGWFQEGYALFARAAKTSQEQNETLAHSLHLYAASFALSLHQKEEATAHLAYAEQSEDPKSKAYALHLQGRLAQQSGEHSEAQRYQEESLAQSRQLGIPTAILRSLHALGDLACRRGERGAGQAYFAEGLSIARSLGGPEALAEALNQLGTLAGMTGDYERARDYFAESHDHYQEVGSLFGRARTLNNRAILLYLQGDIEASYDMRQRCLVLCRDLGSPVELTRALSHLSSTARALERYDEAESYAKESIALGQEHDDVRGTTQALGALAYIYIQQKRFAEAREYWHKATLLAQDMDLAPVGLHLLAIYAELQLAQGAEDQGVALLGYLHNHPLADKQTGLLRQKLYDEYIATQEREELATHSEERIPWQQMISKVLQEPASP